MLRSILSVLGGFVITAACVMIGTIVTARLMLGTRSREDMMKMTPTPKYIAVNLVYSAAFAVLGGFLTAQFAGHDPIPHALVLAGLMFVLGLMSFLQGLKQKTPQGRGYSATLVILGPVSAILGGWLRSRCA